MGNHPVMWCKKTGKGPKMNQNTASCGASLLTTEDVAARLQVSKRHIHNLVTDGDFPPPMKVGRLNRWRELDVDFYIDGLALSAERAPAVGSV